MGIPRGTVAPLGTFPRLSRRCGIAALARLAPLALLRLLAAERGSECGRRWVATEWSWPAGRSPRPGGTMGVPPKDRAEHPALRAAAKTLAFFSLSVLGFLPFLF